MPAKEFGSDSSGLAECTCGECDCKTVKECIDEKNVSCNCAGECCKSPTSDDMSWLEEQDLVLTGVPGLPQADPFRH